MRACLIFDCDGVLVDSEAIAACVAAECFTRAGMPVTVDELITKFAGLSGDKVTAELTRQFGVTVAPDFTEQRRHRIMRAFESELKAIPGVVRVLSSLPQLKCVASSSHPERVALSLRVSGLNIYFGKRVFSATLVARGKPAPDLFLYASNKMARQPDECVVVEDSAHGIAAAKAAGMVALGFIGGSHCSAGRGAELEAAGADAIFSSMERLPALIAGMATTAN